MILHMYIFVHIYMYIQVYKYVFIYLLRFHELQYVGCVHDLRRVICVYTCL